MYDPTFDAPSQDVRKWAMVMHLAGLASLCFVPFASILAPLVIWLIKREEHPYLDDQGKQVLNFQISMWIYGLIAGVTIFVLKFIFIGYLLIPVIPLIFLLQVGGSVWGALKANRGELVRYPAVIRFI